MITRETRIGKVPPCSPETGGTKQSTFNSLVPSSREGFCAIGRAASQPRGRLLHLTPMLDLLDSGILQQQRDPAGISLIAPENSKRSRLVHRLDQQRAAAVNNEAGRIADTQTTVCRLPMQRFERWLTSLEYAYRMLELIDRSLLASRPQPPEYQ